MKNCQIFLIHPVYRDTLIDKGLIFLKTRELYKQEHTVKSVAVN